MNDFQGLQLLIRAFMKIPSSREHIRKLLFGEIQYYANQLYLEGSSYSKLRELTENTCIIFEEFGGSLLVFCENLTKLNRKPGI